MFQPGMNYSLKSELEKNRSGKSNVEETILNDFAAFKRKSDPYSNAGSSSTGLMNGSGLISNKERAGGDSIMNFKNMQAFPSRRDEPASFQ